MNQPTLREDLIRECRFRADAARVLANAGKEVGNLPEFLDRVAAALSAQPVVAEPAGIDHVECQYCGAHYSCRSCGGHTPEVVFAARSVEAKTAVPIAWLDKFGDPHRREEDAREAGDETTPTPLYAATSTGAAPEPIDMVLHCPACGVQHIDAPDWNPVASRTEFAPLGWDNPPHRSHLCHGCGHVWRPSDVPTNGVAAIKTKGKDDSPTGVAPGPSGCAHPSWKTIKGGNEQCELCGAVGQERRYLRVDTATPPTGQAAPAQVEPVTVSVDRMVESHRVTHFVQLHRSGVTYSVHQFDEHRKNRADYEAASLRHLLGQGAKPDVLDYLDVEDNESPPAPAQVLDDAIAWTNPAPNAAVPMAPSGITRTIPIGAPAPAQVEPSAWMASDGRVIPASTKDGALRDGGAIQSSTNVYSIPLYALATQPEAAAGQGEQP